LLGNSEWERQDKQTHDHPHKKHIFFHDTRSKSYWALLCLIVYDSAN
jgi:hypothetical protein